jgi:heterotetrameric sarcosine oxidase delta subunit
MMQVPCPFCGLRDETEFTYGGYPSPAPGPEASNATWAAYLFTRPLPDGPQDELWRHAHGCGQWFTLRRDPAKRSFAPSLDQEAVDG